MTESLTLTIQLSPQDKASLEAEAERRNLSPEALAQIFLHNTLTQVQQNSSALTALQRLRQLTEDLPPSDPVELVRLGRQELEQRSNF